MAGAERRGAHQLGGGLGGRSIHDRARIRIKTALTSLESISRSRVPRRGAPERHVPRGVAILPREVAVAAPNWQNGLPAPLARDRGAPRPQRGHPDSRVALSSRLDQVSLRCWLDTSPPRRRDAPHAHDAGAEQAADARLAAEAPDGGADTEHGRLRAPGGAKRRGAAEWQWRRR